MLKEFPMNLTRVEDFIREQVNGSSQDDQRQSMILVAGASSKPGRKLIPMLTEKGYRVRTMTRDPHKVELSPISLA
jgi:hypothetical protein